MTKEQFQQHHSGSSPLYKILAKKLQLVISEGLQHANIPYDSVPYRIKSFKSAYDKYVSKNYKEPFSEIKDWCGLRIICYYLSDIEKISDFLYNNFIIIYKKDKSEEQSFDKFGYRSVHFIIKLKDDWLVNPEYKKLKGLEAEVQVRTIAMHTWAQIEHKLQYKTITAAPQELRRQLLRLSAKLEEADEQFQAVRDGIEAYNVKLKERANNINAFAKEELNTDVLEAFADIAFSDDLVNKNIGIGGHIIIYTEAGITMEDVVNAYNEAGDLLSIVYDYENKFLASDSPKAKLITPLAISALLDIANHKLENHWRLNTPTGQHPSPLWEPIGEARKVLQERRTAQLK